MRKIVVSNWVSVDGYIATLDNKIDWVLQDPGVDKATHELMHPDTLLVGGTTYRGLESFWVPVGADPKSPPPLKKLADELTQMHKIVFSKSMKPPTWENSKLYKGNLIEHVKTLKASKGEDIVIFGSGTLVPPLADAGLIDEYLLAITPRVLGKGKEMFDAAKRFDLELIETRNFPTGNILLHYRTAPYAFSSS